MDGNANEVEARRAMLARLGAARGAQKIGEELAALSEDEREWVFKLAELEDEEFEELLITIGEDNFEVRAIVVSAREAVKASRRDVEVDDLFEFSTRIVGVYSSPYLGLVSGMPVVRLVFRTADNRNVLSDQDLEDTLGIGALTLEAVASTVVAIKEKFNIAGQEVLWGDEFEDRLESVEKSAATLRQYFDGASM